MKEKTFIYNAASIVDPLEVQRIDRQLAARRAKLMKELRERICRGGAAGRPIQPGMSAILPSSTSAAVSMPQERRTAQRAGPMLGSLAASMRKVAR